MNEFISREAVLEMVMHMPIISRKEHSGENAEAWLDGVSDAKEDLYEAFVELPVTRISRNLIMKGVI